MKYQMLIILTGLTLVMAGVQPGNSQTLGEMDAVMQGMDTLQQGPVGPSPGVINRVQGQLSGQPGAPAPAPQPQPAVPMMAPAPQAAGEVFDGTPDTVLRPPETQPGEEGTPFSMSAASQFANQGMMNLRAMRFNEAAEAYRQAKEADSRYEDFFNKVVSLRDAVNAGKLNEVRKEKVKPGFDLTWGQFLGWERQPATGMPYGPGFGYGMQGAYPGMYPGAAGPYGPGMMEPGMGPGPMGPMGPMF